MPPAILGGVVTHFITHITRTGKNREDLSIKNSFTEFYRFPPRHLKSSGQAGTSGTTGTETFSQWIRVERGASGGKKTKVEHLHESPLDCVQCFRQRQRVQREFQQQAARPELPEEASVCPGLPSPAEAASHEHRGGGWLPRTAPLGGGGSCSRCIWKTNPGIIKKQTILPPKSQTFDSTCGCPLSSPGAGPLCWVGRVPALRPRG